VLAPPRLGELVFPLAQRYVDRVALIPDDAIRQAQTALWTEFRVAAEPGGAAAFAALLAGRYQPSAGERVGVLVSGGNFAAWERDEPYTIALLIKGRSGGASTKHLYRSGTSSTGDHILWLTSGTTPNLRHQASSGGTVTITSSVAIVNDTTWSTIVGTWRPGRLELFVDGFPRASSTAAATNTSALFGIYRWGWGFSTSQDFNGDIALIACFASSWTPAMVRRWHADPFGFLRPWNEVPALMGSAPPATPPSTGTGVVTFLMG
jgi:hypothetical protein